jgi:excisionase family DNA binding protein
MTSRRGARCGGRATRDDKGGRAPHESAKGRSEGEPGHGSPNEQLLTVDDLARLLRVPRATIYPWRSTGDGPSGYTIGRYVRFRRAVVETWLEERADEPGREHG